ncbi:hypothetical protein ElyMa_004878300 [Elysia marginata]|uniref:Uncharacterized protein n=1 Tax=Elysia marginata TaxID=1093978 RepID=A0AAV4IXI7_9GAST|nr:hypothetical protein ElyMa_004878300 [Elysia marginata]
MDLLLLLNISRLDLRRHDVTYRSLLEFSFPGRVKPRSLKLVLAADPPSVWHYGFSVKYGRLGVRIMWLSVVYASAPYITVWQHAFNCPKRCSDITSKLTGTLKFKQTTNQAPFDKKKLITGPEPVRIGPSGTHVM